MGCCPSSLNSYINSSHWLMKDSTPPGNLLVRLKEINLYQALVVQVWSEPWTSWWGSISRKKYSPSLVSLCFSTFPRNVMLSKSSSILLKTNSFSVFYYKHLMVSVLALDTLTNCQQYIGGHVSWICPPNSFYSFTSPQSLKLSS